MEIEWVPPSAERAEELFAACPGYFQRLHGRACGPDDVRDLLEDKPPGVEEKHTWMAVLEGQTIGVIEFLRDYPQPGTLYIGLLMVREDRQGQGWGARFWRHIEAQGRHFRLAVLEDNAPALAFWERMGFAASGEIKPWRQHRAVLMEKSTQG